MNALARQRRRMFDKHPFCHWCGVQLLWIAEVGKSHPRMATIDHLRNKHDPSRRERPKRSGEIRRVLACHKCNVKRPNLFRPYYTPEELWKQSGQWPRMAYVFGALPSEVA